MSRNLPTTPSTDAHDVVREMGQAGVLSPDFVRMAQADPQLMSYLQSSISKMNLPDSPRRSSYSSTAAGTSANVPNPTDFLHQQAEEASRRQEENSGRPPFKALVKPRAQHIQAHLKAYEQASRISEMKTQVVQTFCGIPKGFSTQDLTSLRKREVPAGENRRSSWETIGLYNFPLHGATNSGPEIGAIFASGRVFAIKEPIYKPTDTGGDVLIRVDSPTDFVFLAPDHPAAADASFKFPDPSFWPQITKDHKAVGNSAFTSKQYLLAAHEYTAGIDKCTPSESDKLLLLYLNRAAAQLRLSNFRSAYQDAQRVLQLLDTGVGAPSNAKAKALLRRAKAEEGMGLFSAAATSFRALLALTQDNDARDGLRRMEDREREAHIGEYNFVTMFRKGSDTGRNPHQNVANFVGPIEVRTAGDREGGRGMFATRDVGPGELLLCEKAFAIAYPSLQKDRQKLVMATNLLKRTVDSESQVGLVSAVIAKLLDDGSLVKTVHSLFGGSSMPAPLPFPTSTLSNLDDETAAVIDPARIEAICSFNSFGPLPMKEAGTLPAPKDPEAAHLNSPSALFVRGSMFNHSCAPNANWNCFSDVMVVRARAAIKDGEEIFVAYTCGTNNYDERSKALKKHFPLGCPCPLCQLDRLDGPSRLARRSALESKQRDALQERVRKTRASGPFTTLISDLKKYLSDLNSTYVSARGALRPALSDAAHILADVYNNASVHSDKYFEETLQADLDFLLHRGALITRSPRSSKLSQVHDITVQASTVGTSQRDFDSMIGLANAKRLEQRGKMNAAKAWMRMALALSEIDLGGGKPLFEARYGSMLDEWDLRRLWRTI